MPVFEYKCQECGEEFEELVFGQNPDVVCVKCNSRKVKKKLSVFGMGGAEKSGSGCSSCTSSSCKSCH
ncbi:MAG: zinc ribbon domain-containing protein [Nitrospirota bacterium]